MKFAADMDQLSVKDAKGILEAVGSLGNGLRYLPFAQLRATHQHRFGSLRLWPKFKNFLEQPSWDTFRWRPLVSFEHHRWRRLFSLLSRF